MEILEYTGDRLSHIRCLKIVILLLLAAWFTTVSTADAATPPKQADTKRVLEIIFYAEGLPFPGILVESLRSNLLSNSPYPVELNIEYEDRMRYPDDANLQKLTDLLHHKYSQPPMDVIFGLGDEAADLVAQYGEAMFGNIPMILVSANPKYSQRSILKPHLTNLVWGADIQANVILIEKLLPNTRHLFIVSGSSQTDREAAILARAMPLDAVYRYFAKRQKENLPDEMKLMLEASTD